MDVFDTINNRIDEEVEKWVDSLAEEDVWFNWFDVSSTAWRIATSLTLEEVVELLDTEVKLENVISVAQQMIGEIINDRYAHLSYVSKDFDKLSYRDKATFIKMLRYGEPLTVGYYTDSLSGDILKVSYSTDYTVINTELLVGVSTYLLFSKRDLHKLISFECAVTQSRNILQKQQDLLDKRFQQLYRLENML